MSKKGVIFDFDGTLADTLSDVADAVNAGLRTFGLPERSITEVCSFIGDGIFELCRRAAGESSSVPIEDLAAAIGKYYQQHRMDRATPFPGIPELLDKLTERGISMAVLSNKLHEHTQPMVDELFDKWSFVAVEGCSDEDLRKPDPRRALKIVKKMQLKPTQVMMVGDSSADIITGINAGLIAVGVTWGYRSREELVNAGPKYLIDRPAELLDII
ncbi:MAG: HAD family hydrolase [Planctomycetota bacterium]|nr:MAG: HAD family hydrolase [Planctomycetota bacterium]